MAGRTATRALLKAAAYETAGITEHEASALVELVLVEITNALTRGETVKLASFGTFSTRQKRARIGRNPKTGEVVPISPRRVVVFRPSQILKGRIRAALAEKELPGRNAASASRVLTPGASA
ncbi:MAG: integration host factor subunit alpha [Rhodoplanes sp.]